MMNISDFFNQEKQCIYKGETYSVRDNGAIMRHARDSKPKRQKDEVWTFGIKGPKGYMVFCSEQVHRIVATAFHGEAPTSQHIVDHIDTNRCNNRPENLRWITKLENILDNPITRRRVIMVCGSIEEFLKNPAKLGESKADPNFSWMRTVSPAEAKVSREKFEAWAKEDRQVAGNGKLGEWVYHDKQWGPEDTVEEDMPIEKQSLTLNAMQVNWKVPSEFPLCPSVVSDEPLQDYLNNISEGKLFAKNAVYQSEVIKADFDKDRKAIVVMASGGMGYALAKIEYKSNMFYHTSIRTFITDEGAEKYYTIERGYEWTGGDVFDDFF